MNATSVVRLHYFIVLITWAVMGLMAAQPSYASMQSIASQAPADQQQTERVAFMTEREKEAFEKFVAHEARFKNHYQSHYSTSHYDYNQYRPAYQHGFELALDPSQPTKDWNSVEAQAHRTWDESKMGLWNQYKDAVRYGWEQGVALERK